VLAASIIALVMEAAGTSVTLFIFNQTTLRNNPKDSHHHSLFSKREGHKYTLCQMTCKLENAVAYFEGRTQLSKL
jgi:hypothetical protein